MLNNSTDPVQVDTSSNGRAGVEDIYSDIFFAAVSKTRMPIILTDPNQPDNPIVFANDAFLKMTKYYKEEVVGKNCRLLQGPETDRETVRQIRNAIANERDISVEILNYKADGSSFWNALFISPVYGRKDHKLEYFFASQLDVSRRRDAEDALHQAQKMEALGQLTGGIAHDFNNLLQIVSGFGGTLHESISSGNYNQQKMLRAIGAILTASGRAAKLTHQLLSFSRKQRLEGRVINLNSLVSMVSDIADATLGDNIKIVKMLDDSLHNTRIDPTQAEVAFLNCMINARDAMAEGGTIKIVTSNIKISVTERDLVEGDYVQVSIIDNGSGIPPEILKKVMEPFFTTKAEGKGTGLGLSTVYGFTKQSGGTVKIKSTVGEGTSVSLIFPATEMPMVLAAKSKDHSTTGKEVILVVDDRQEVAETAAMMLEDFGYITRVETDPNKALTSLSDVDLVLTDVVMPGMDGITLANESKKNNPNLKIVLMTGYSQDDNAMKSSEYPVIYKPFNRVDLGRKIRQTLDGPDGVS